MKSPAGLTITPRDIAFGREESRPRWWLGGDPVGTAFFNAFSATFPLGERFFIDSVRHYRDRADGELKAQIAAFITQEAIHTREHVAFNRQVTEHGYDVAKMEQRTRERIDFIQQRHPVAQLATTVALEHFTAILAHALLADPRLLAGAPEEARRLWSWHAIEEIEHKAVAFDTFARVTERMSGFHRWTVRSRIMLLSTYYVSQTLIRNMRDIFRQDGMDTARTWRRAFAWFWLKPGILRRVLPAYLAYYLPGFHPWKHDDRPLLARAEAALAGSPA